MTLIQNDNHLFFEAFDIPKEILGKKKYVYKIKCKKCGCIAKYDLSSYYSVFVCKNCKHMNGEGVKEYPPVKDKHILSLIRVILDKYETFKFWTCAYAEYEGIYNVNVIYAETRQTGCNCMLNATGLNEAEAVISLCTKLKDEIYNEVREIFIGSKEV
jgi:hypothetical protein